MHYKRAETIGTKAPHSRSHDPASQVLRGGSAEAHDIETFWQAISLQAAARTARYAEGSSGISQDAVDAFHTIGIQQEKRERAPLTPSFNMVITSTIGVVVFACITYFMMGGNLLLRQ